MGWTQIFVKGQPKDYQGDRSLEDMVEFVNDNAGTARRADGTVDTAYGRLPEVDKVLAQMKELNEENVAKVKEALAKIPDEKESILKEGQWNTLRLKVQGDRVQTWLNGEEMVDLTDAKIGAAQGRIALQIHDGGGIKVLWRNLRLTTL